MKKLIYILLICIFNIQVSGHSRNLLNNNIAGIYKTGFGEMTLSINGNHVTGTYKNAGGKIDGILTGHILKGTWTQTNGKGKIEFIFNDNFSAFKGKWSYNSAAPSGVWNGTKTSTVSNSTTKTSSTISNNNIAGTYKTDYGEMTLRTNGNRITGTYANAGGKIDGILTGHTLKGTWTQTNGKGKIEFIFNTNFSAFTGKWGRNNAAPSSKWNGTKIGSTSSTGVVQPSSNSDPINQPNVSSQPIVGNQIFNNGNRSGVGNGVKSNTYFYVGKTTTISSISNYHWNNGKGAQPGKIGLRNYQGTILGTWQSVGSDGMGGVKNANWTVYPNITLQPGIYQITDSEPSTWSQNEGSFGAGFSIVNAK